MMFSVPRQFAAGCLLLAAVFGLAASGCSKKPFQVVPTTGVCTYNGEPLSGGLLILNPVRDQEKHGQKMQIGKPAQALIQPDGTFVMSTYGKNDGAVIGKHLVYLNLAVLDEDDPKQPCKSAPKDLVVEVKPGKNYLAIDLADSNAGK